MSEIKEFIESNFVSLDEYLLKSAELFVIIPEESYSKYTMAHRLVWRYNDSGHSLYSLCYDLTRLYVGNVRDISDVAKNNLYADIFYELLDLFGVSDEDTDYLYESDDKEIDDELTLNIPLLNTSSLTVYQILQELLNGNEKRKSIQDTELS